MLYSRPPGEAHGGVAPSPRAVGVSRENAAVDSPKECSTRRANVARCRREDGQSRIRIRKVQSCVAETVGMGHHGRTALVYAGNISWK